MREFSIMSVLMNAGPNLAVLREDLAALTRDVASLFEHMKGSATNTFRTPPARLNGAFGAHPRNGSARRSLRQSDQSLH